MPTAADVDRLRRANRSLVERMRGDLDGFWSSLDLRKPERVRDALIDYLPFLVDRYGDASVAVAGEWYEQMRAKALPRARSFNAVAGPPVTTGRVVARTQYAARHLFEGNPEATRSFLKMATSEYALQPGRDTVIESIKADPARPRYARVPSGAKTCAFCLMLASRGAEYLSARSAGQGNKFHGDCDCQAVAIFTEDDLPEDYDPDALLGRFQEAQTEAEGNSTKAALSKLREMQGIS